MTGPRISIVAATHPGSPFRRGFIEAFRTQRIYTPKLNEHGVMVHYYTDGFIQDGPFEIIFISDGELDHKVTKRDEPADLVKYFSVIKEPVPCCGHNTRSYGIGRAAGDFIILTNDDNYYVSGFISRLTDEIRAHPCNDMYTWNCVNNLWKWEAWNCRLQRGKIDLGCAAVKADIAREVGFPWRHYDGDYDYLDACAKMSRKSNVWPGVHHINEVLFVHN